MKIVLCLLLVLPMVPAPPTDTCKRTCENGGICVEADESSSSETAFVCDCTNTGYTGKYCRKVDKYTCSCQNGGTCVVPVQTSSSESASTEIVDVCDCPSGYTGDLCRDDINECTAGSHNCHTNAACTNSPPGSFTCTCNSGYEGTGVVCTDINECTAGSHNCHTNAACTDSPPGSFTCTCNSGYTGSGDVCTAIGNCSPPCENGGSCVSSPCSASEYECLCNPGYTGPNCETVLPTR